MLTSKQRSFLRSMANPIDAIFQVGKGGINENLIRQLDDALEARELIKIRLLPNSGLEIRDVCAQLAQELGAEGVQIIGTKFVLYRRSKNSPRIELPLS